VLVDCTCCPHASVIRIAVLMKNTTPRAFSSFHLMRQCRDRHAYSPTVKFFLSHAESRLIGCLSCVTCGSSPLTRPWLRGWRDVAAFVCSRPVCLLIVVVVVVVLLLLLLLLLLLCCCCCVPSQEWQESALFAFDLLRVAFNSCSAVLRSTGRHVKRKVEAFPLGVGVAAGQAELEKASGLPLAMQVETSAVV